MKVLTSATAAVEVALQLAGIGPGDEVITSAQSFFTVLNMIVKVGATPVFVDCDLVTRNIDLAAVEAAITPRTKAIMPTHWPGSLVDMDALYALARRHELRVIEDAALVLGSQWKGRNVGAIGDLVTFSFHPNKNITTIEGGALVVNDAAEAKRVDALRFHGITYLPDRTRDVAFPGGKFNLPDVNARIGVAQLERLPAFLAARRALVDRYFERFIVEPACVLPPRPRRRRRAIVEHVEHAAAARPPRNQPARIPRRDGVPRDRHRCIVRGAAPVHARPPLRWQRRGLSQHRAHRARNGHAAAACGNERRRRRSRLHRGRRKSSPPPGHDNDDMTTMAQPQLSVVIPVYNEEGGLPALFGRLYPALDALGVGYEVIFVNDGSRDRSAALLREQWEARPDVTRVVLFNANYGQHLAIVAGFERCRGERIVTLDADLQNPPEEIGKLLAAMDAGHDYVGGVRRTREDSWWRRVASTAMNRLRERSRTSR